MPAFLAPTALPRAARRRRALTPRRPRPRAAASQDPYDVLDVPRTADAATVKRAYRRAALKNHPDVSDAKDARERFLRVQEAYAVLSDPSKRAAYDRRSQSGSPFSGFPGFDDAFGGGAGTGFDADFARRWREANPMPDDLDDNLGSIFSDIFSGVASAVGSNAVVDDFVEFLEKGVDGFRDDGLGDILRTRDPDVLDAELEDARFVVTQLRSRKSRAEEEAGSLRERASQWGVRAERADGRREFDVRDAARDREAELVKEASRFEERAKKASQHVVEQERRIRKISERLDVVRGDAQASKTEASFEKNAASGGGKKTGNEKEAIDDELERMKREMGL